VQRKLGNLPDAQASYARARDLAAAAADARRASVAMESMAILHEERREYREALRILELEAVARIDERLGHADLAQDREALERVRAKVEA
jgi:hypothetical protein